MIRRHPRVTGLVLVLVVGAIAAPSASALPIEQFRPDDRPGGAQARQVDRPPTQVRLVRTAANPGFDWGDAGIGAGGAFALTMIGLGGALVVSNRRHRKARLATTA
jgi:hypothetical protein